MSKNRGIAIGINQYTYLQSLQYAKRDAESVRDLWLNQVGFDKVYLFTDDSPKIPTKSSSIPTQPTFGHLVHFLRLQFEKPQMKPGDNLWFFFAGHGIRHAECDYLTHIPHFK